MRITMIRPNMYDDRSSDAMEPLCFAILKSLTPPDIDISFFDERLEPIPVDHETDLVALTVETYTASRAYEIADGFRRKGIAVVMGGYHPTFLPDEALQHADAVVKGDAEGVWERVLEDARGGTMQGIYESPSFPSLDRSMPDRSIFAGKQYAPIGLVQFSRGCRFNCSFCSIRAFYGSSLRHRPVADVVEDIRRSGRRHIFLVDDNLFVDSDIARELFTALIPLNISWSCQVSIDIARDTALVRLMRRSGCISALVGFESLDIDSLRELKKHWNVKWQSYDEAIGVFRRAGIMLYGTFVLGCDTDTVDSFGKLVEFSLRNKFLLANFNPLTPMPGSPLFETMKSEGRLLHDKWWLDPGFCYGDATFEPRGMSPDELTRGCFHARKRFNSTNSIVRRMLDVRANLRTPHRAGIYLAANLVSRREILRKQGRRLGSIKRPKPRLESQP
ncbi:MAG: B12-binding domain-containing radical SAM protein [Gammaproteobacteria bacterium]|nr:B12-binding domain-containing radical SAM protein [Gammaproteobacteria bacterium]